MGAGKLCFQAKLLSLMLISIKEGSPNAAPHPAKSIRFAANSTFGESLRLHLQTSTRVTREWKSFSFEAPTQLKPPFAKGRRPHREYLQNSRIIII